MILLSTLLASSLIGDAHAQDDDKMGLRVKLTTPLYARVGVTEDTAGTEVESSTSGISLFNGGARGEFTYMLGEGLEIGAILGYSSISSEYDGDDAGSANAMTAALTGAYNLPLGDGVRGYLQPIVGLQSQGGELAGFETSRSGLTFGADLGARFRVVKRSTIDLGLEYMMWNPSTEVDGEESDDYSYKSNSLGVMFGISTIL